MKVSVFRGFLLGCITMVLAAFSFTAPVLAFERAGPTANELRVYDPVDIGSIALPAITVTERQTIGQPSVRRSAEPAELTPVYRMSMLTDGQSLSAYQVRC